MNNLAALNLGQRMKFLAKDTAIYGIAGSLNKMMALITFPLLARHFSVAEFGFIDLLNTAVVVLATLLVFGQDSAVARYFYDNDDVDHRRQVISQSLAFQLAVVAVVTPLFWNFAPSIAQLFPKIERSTDIIRLVALQGPFFMLLNFAQNILKWTLRRWEFLFISLASTAATTAALLIAVFFFELDVVMVFLIYLLARMVFGLLGLWFVRGWLSWPSGWGRLREMAPFAVSSGALSIAGALQPFLERGVTQGVLGTTQLGLYAAGAKVGMLIGLPIAAMELSWGPFALSLYRQADAGETFRRVLTVATFLLCALVLALTAIAGPVVVLLGSQRYSAAAAVVFPLSMGLALQAASSISTIGITFSKKAHLKIYGYAVLIAAAALLLPGLGRAFGISGVAWATFVAFLVRIILETFLAQRAYWIAFDFRWPIAIISATIIIGLAIQFPWLSITYAGVGIVPLFASMALCAILATNLFSKSRAPTETRLPPANF